MTLRTDMHYLQDILTAIGNIESHRSVGSATFTVNQAVAFNLVLIGEAANQLSPELISKHPEIAWRDIINTRNKIVHGYFGINYDVVWKIVENHLPDLREKIQNMMDRETH